MISSTPRDYILWNSFKSKVSIIFEINEQLPRPRRIDGVILTPFVNCYTTSEYLRLFHCNIFPVINIGYHWLNKVSTQLVYVLDVASKYLVNGFPYLGKDESRRTGMRLADHVVMKLMEPYFGKGRNVTTNSFFASLSLAKDLQLQNTSIVGTVNRVRWELPPLAAVVQNKELYSSTVLKHDMYTLTSASCKLNKNVVLMSSLHQSVGVALDPKKIPETIEFYISTKYGLNVVDQMVRKYPIKASSRRWPVQVFYNILDLAAINSWILYK